MFLRWWLNVSAENGRLGHLLAARCVMRALGGGAEGRRRRGLQGSVWERRARDDRESTAMRKMLWAGQCEGVTAMCSRCAYIAAGTMWRGLRGVGDDENLSNVRLGSSVSERQNRKRMLHNKNYSKNGIYVSVNLNVRFSGSSFESHISLSYLELSDKTISTFARQISNERHRVWYIQRQMCTSHSRKVEKEWHLFLF
jgi:hypothetical protein